jgi:hypothetical protein
MVFTAFGLTSSPSSAASTSTHLVIKDLRAIIAGLEAEKLESKL